MNETRESKDTAYWHERPKDYKEEKPDTTLPPHPKAPYIYGPLNSPPPAPPLVRLIEAPRIPNPFVLVTNPSPDTPPSGV